MQPTIVDQVRSFNRFYTREVAHLLKHLADSKFTLAEARVLYELAQTPEQTSADIVRSLDMDKAHISRIVMRFRNASLIMVRVSPDRRKQKLLSLTAAGKRASRRLNRGSDAHVDQTNNVEFENE